MLARGIETQTDELRRLRTRLAKLREKLIEWEAKLSRSGDAFSGRSYESARNLAHYLALRSEDLRPLQSSLAASGLSSLGRSESHVLASIEAVLSVLDRTSPGDTTDREPHRPLPLSGEESRAILAERSDALFGPPPEARSVRIMVTAPDDAAHDYALVRDLLVNGMNCMRINCAHGDQDAWRSMIQNLRRAERELGTSCRVLMDLVGPRARTGPIEPGPAVVKVKPRRDPLGWVTRPAEIWLTAQETPVAPPEAADAVLHLPARFLGRIAPGDRLELRDTRDAKRRLFVVEGSAGGCWARLRKTAYLTSGTTVRRRASGRKGVRGRAKIGGIPPIAQRILLHEGDRLILTRDQQPGRLRQSDVKGSIASPAQVPCTPPEVLEDVRIGEPIWLDEGRIGGRILSINEDQAVVSITSADPAGAYLGSSKGINLPESDLRRPSLTAQDIATLPFVAEHADLVGYSFLRTTADLDELYRRLHELPGRQPGVILKIETLKAFQNLPAILLDALRRPAAGVMIARGDLAVECGFERLAEVQEEILWLCEASHLPVIWATQVLEGLAKRGLASRAEITDAAVGERAECVMLNKGAFIVETVRALDGILQRMQEHQEKKQSLLRHLRVVDAFLEGLTERTSGEGE